MLEEKRIAALREKFIAILGHDLRNPVSAFSSSVSLMNMLPLDDTMKKISSIIQNSSYRISGLIDNMLDFARGRLGEGIILSMSSGGLENTLQNVVSELKAVWPARDIEADIHLSSSVYCDTNRIGQLFSNLLSNAMTYGDESKPVRIKATIHQSQLILSVAN